MTYTQLLFHQTITTIFQYTLITQTLSEPYQLIIVNRLGINGLSAISDFDNIKPDPSQLVNCRDPSLFIAAIKDPPLLFLLYPSSPN